MAGEFDATVDATVAGGEAVTEGKYPWEWSVEEIAVAAAQAGATAYCGAVGLGPAAPLCGMLAAEVMGWAMDNIVGPIGGAIADLFDPGTEPARLIIRDACNQGPYLTGRYDDYYTSFLLRPIGVHRDLGLPGTYQYREAIWSMGVRGLELPRRVDYLDAFSGLLLRGVPFPPDFSAEYAIYKAVRLRELEGVTVPMSRWDPLRAETTYWRAPMSLDDKCAQILNEFEDGRIQTWIDFYQRKMAEEIANLIEVSIALEIQRRGRLLLGARPDVDILTRVSPPNIAIVAIDSQLSLLAEAAQPDAIQKWIEADPRNAPPWGWSPVERAA